MAVPSSRRIWHVVLTVLALWACALPASAETRSTGTAFVVHSEGLLLTCFHVIKDAGRIEVRLDGKVYRAAVVGTDPERDLALLQVDAASLPALPWIKAEDVELGEEVRAFGFPLTTALGSSLKVTRGTISGVEREAGQPVFQIDSAVNPGNSGGPLVNDRGEVVGVVVARFADALGVGYVTPVDTATPLLRGLLPLRPGERRVRFEGPALVHRVSPSVALVTCVPLAETGRLPAPFQRDFPKTASVPPPAPQPAERPDAAPLAREKPAADKPAVAASNPSQPPLDAPAPARPVVDPMTKAIDLPAKAEEPAKAETTTSIATQPLAAPVKPAPPTPVKPEPAPNAARPETAVASAKPEKCPQPAAPKPETMPGPDSAAAEKPAVDVDAELCKIRSADPPEFPQPAAQAVVPDASRAEWTITNATDAVLTILVRGEEKRAITIEPKKSVTIMLTPGKYEVAGRLALDSISPFYGNQEFTKGGRYQSRFRVELQ